MDPPWTMDQAGGLFTIYELVSGAARIAVLVNPANATNTESILRCVEPAARSMGLQIQVLNASTTARSMRPSQLWGASGPTHFSLAATAFSPAGGCKLLSWRRSARSPRPIHSVNMPKPVG